MQNEIREYTIETGDRRRWYVLHALSIAHAFAQVRVFEKHDRLTILEVSQPLTAR